MATTAPQKPATVVALAAGPQRKRSKTEADAGGDASPTFTARASKAPPTTHSINPAIPFLTQEFVDKVIVAVASLKERGYAVIPGILDDAECDTMWDMMWDFIGRTSNGRVDRADPTTWRHEWPVALHWILKNYNVGQSQPTWYARGSLAVIAVFALIYGTDKLFCSYDGFAMIPDVKQMDSHADGEDASLRENNWMHFDQTPYLADMLLCLQAWVTCREVNEGAPTLKVLPESHKRLGEFVAKGYAPKTKADGPDTTHWYKPSSEDTAAVFGDDWESNLVRVECPKGSMVLWDSRTMHQGGVPIAGYEGAQKDRGIVYVCYAPASQCEAAGRGAVRRKELAADDRTTAHWPQFLKPNGKNPRTYGQEMPPTTDLTGEREALIAKYPEHEDRIRMLAGEKAFENGKGLLGWTGDRAPLMDIKDPVKAISDFRAKQRSRKRKSDE